MAIIFIYVVTIIHCMLYFFPYSRWKHFNAHILRVRPIADTRIPIFLASECQLNDSCITAPKCEHWFVCFSFSHSLSHTLSLSALMTWSSLHIYSWAHSNDAYAFVYMNFSMMLRHFSQRFLSLTVKCKLNAY